MLAMLKCVALIVLSNSISSQVDNSLFQVNDIFIVPQILFISVEPAILEVQYVCYDALKLILLTFLGMQQQPLPLNLMTHGSIQLPLNFDI